MGLKSKNKSHLKQGRAGSQRRNLAKTGWCGVGGGGGGVEEFS